MLAINTVHSQNLSSDRPVKKACIESAKLESRGLFFSGKFFDGRSHDFEMSSRASLEALFEKLDIYSSGQNLRDEVVNDMLVDFYKGCAKFSSCNMFGIWQLTKEPYLGSRKLALYLLMDYLRSKIPNFPLAKQLSINLEKILHAVKDIKTTTYTDADRAHAKKIYNTHLSMYQSFGKKSLTRLGSYFNICTNFLADPQCVTRLAAVYDNFMAHNFNASELGQDRGGPTIYFGFPSKFYDFATDERYVELLRIMNVRMLQFLIDQENVGSSKELLPGSHSVVDLIADSAKNVFACNSAQCTDKVRNTHMSIYGVRGASAVFLFNYYNRNHNPLWIQFSIFGNLLNYMDSSYEKLSSGNIFSIPNSSVRDCTIPKPYYYWLSRVLGEDLISDGYLDNNENIETIFRINVGYQLMGFSRLPTKKSYEYIKNANSLPILSIRRDLVLSLLGAEDALKPANTSRKSIGSYINSRKMGYEINSEIFNISLLRKIADKDEVLSNSDKLQYYHKWFSNVGYNQLLESFIKVSP